MNRNSPNTMDKKCGLYVLAIVGLAVSSPALGQLSDPGGRLEIGPAPRSVKENELEGRLYAFEELRNVRLVNDLEVDATVNKFYGSNSALTPGIIPAGTYINSYYIHWDGMWRNRDTEGYVSFSGETILGVVERDMGLFRTNIFGATNTYYPGLLSDRGFEMGVFGHDAFSIENNSTRLRIDYAHTLWGVDDLRVFTLVPAPSSAGVLALGGLAVLRRRRR